MASLKVVLTSVEMVKPLLVPTLNHPKTHQLSFLDQYSPPTHVPFIFYYNYSNTGTISSILLKRSLSETLVEFYPLAGRIRGNGNELSVECNDEGVEFKEAKVCCALSELIESNVDYISDELKGLVPIKRDIFHKDIVVAVQLNHFTCGGVAVAVCVSHKVADAATMAAFINAWATKTTSKANTNTKTTRSNTDHQVSMITAPAPAPAPTLKFNGASLFPPREFKGIYDELESYIGKQKVVTRRLVFDKQKIASLREKVDNDQLHPNPTRVEVISAYIWKCLIEAAKAKKFENPPKIFSAAQVVNLRRRMASANANANANANDGCFGNLYWCTRTIVSEEEKNVEFHELVVKIRRAIESIDGSFIKKLQDGEEPVGNDSTTQPNQAVEGCGFSSYTNFGLYEVDFGWGNPAWVSMASLLFQNLIVFFDTKDNGIEAWVGVLEEDASILNRYLSQDFPDQ